MKTKEIELFGKKVILHERSTRDVQDMITFVRKSEDDLDDVKILTLYLLVIEAALKKNIKSSKIPLIYNRYNRMFTVDALSELPPNRVIELANDVMELEGHVQNGVKKNPEKMFHEKSSTES